MAYDYKTSLCTLHSCNVTDWCYYVRNDSHDNILALSGCPRHYNCVTIIQDAYITSVSLSLSHRKG